MENIISGNPLIPILIIAKTTNEQKIRSSQRLAKSGLLEKIEYLLGARKKLIVLEKFLELGGEVWQFFRSGAETFKNEVFSEN